MEAVGDARGRQVVRPIVGADGAYPLAVVEPELDVADGVVVDAGADDVQVGADPGKGQRIDYAGDSQV